MKIVRRLSVYVDGENNELIKLAYPQETSSVRFCRYRSAGFQWSENWKRN